MTQLNVGGVALPEAKNDAYKCYPQKLIAQKEMISGRIVTEVRGTVQVIEWAYDCLDAETYSSLMTALRADTSIRVAYLPDNSADMASGDFIVTSYPAPTFAFAANNTAVWRNVAFTLREVAPHD